VNFAKSTPNRSEKTVQKMLYNLQSSTGPKANEMGMAVLREMTTKNAVTKSRMMDHVVSIMMQAM
jgi:hypothetical protein